MEKGTYGYINNLRKNRIIISLVVVLAMIIDIVIALVAFGTVKHPVIVIAAVLTLPFAKSIDLLIVTAGFKSISKEKYDLIQRALDNNNDKVVLYDLAISSYEGISYASSMIIYCGNIYCLLGNEKVKNKKEKSKQLLQKLQNLMKTSDMQHEINVYNDFDEYIEVVNNINFNEEIEEGLSGDNKFLGDRIKTLCI